MKRNSLAVVAAILTTLADHGPGKSGLMYAALMGELTLEQYMEVLTLLQGANLITVRDHVVALTPLGLEKATALNALIEKRG